MPLYLANKHCVPVLEPPMHYIPSPKNHGNPFYPRFWEERLEQPYKVKKPVGIFLDDMGDWMADCWSRGQTEAELQMMRDNPQHRIYTLTKRAQNLIKFSPFPENCWVGVTATTQKAYAEAISHLIKVKAQVKFISFEPLLDAVMPSGFIVDEDGTMHDWAILRIAGINWIIIGACTGTLPEMVSLCDRYPDLAVMRYGNKLTAQPRIEWVKEIVEAADKAGIPVFLKDNLEPLLRQSYKTFGELNKKLVKAIRYPSWEWELRQEMPLVRREAPCLS